MPYMNDERKGKGKRYSDARGNTRGHSINGASNKDIRREAAFAREDAFNNLSIAEKLKSLPPTGANRQRTRYTELLAKLNEKASQTSQLVKDAKGMVDRGEAVSLSEAKRILTAKKQTAKAV